MRLWRQFQTFYFLFFFFFFYKKVLHAQKPQKSTKKHKTPISEQKHKRQRFVALKKCLRENSHLFACLRFCAFCAFLCFFVIVNFFVKKNKKFETILITSITLLLIFCHFQPFFALLPL